MKVGKVKLQKGKLYCLNENEINYWTAHKTEPGIDIKHIFHGNILLYTEMVKREQKTLMGDYMVVSVYYVFLDQDGDKLFLAPWQVQTLRRMGG